MPGIVYIDDDFTGLLLDATIRGRVPPVTNSGATWRVDPDNDTAVMGGGNGDVKFSTSAVCKTAVLSAEENNAVHVSVNDYGQAAEFTLGTRDSQSTGYTKYGYGVRVAPRNITAPYFRFVRFDNYTAVNLTANPVPLSVSGNVFTATLECNANVYRFYVNNTLLGTYTAPLPDPYAPNGSNRYVSMRMHSGSSVQFRLERFTVYDALDTAPPTVAYPMVRRWWI